MMASFGLLGAAAGLGKGLVDAGGMIAQGISEDRQHAREEARIRLQAQLQAEEGERTRQHGERIADKEMAHRTDLASKGFEQQQALTEMRFGQEKELAGISHANALTLEGARASREDARLRLRAQLELDNAKQLATAESSKWGAEQQAGILKEEFKTLSGLESDIRKRISEGGYMSEDMGSKVFVPFTQAQMDAARQELNVIESRRRQIDQRLAALTGSKPLYQLETSTLDSYVDAIDPGNEEAGLKLLQERLNTSELAYVQRKLGERKPAEQPAPAPEQSVVTPAMQEQEQGQAAQTAMQPQPVEVTPTEQPGEIWPGIRQMADQIRGIAPSQAEQLIADAPGLMRDIIATADGNPPGFGASGDRRSFQSRIIEWRRKYASAARSAPPEIQEKLRAQGWID